MSPSLNRMFIAWNLSKRGLLCVRKYAPVMWSWMAPMMGPPYLGDRMFSCTCMRILASARASSDCRTCRFISSPSKSALYGGQSVRLNLKVRPSMILTRCAIMDILCSEGCLLNRTTSPSTSCLSTV